jgi:transposase
MRSNLSLLAGKQALRSIRDSGLAADAVAGLAGAAGGPKWLVLYHFDRWLFGEFFRERRRPLFLLGASSGAWRFAAACQADPMQALERFRTAYTRQVYRTVPSPQEVSAEAGRILEAFIPPSAPDQMLAHPQLRLGVLADRARHLVARENRTARLTGLAWAYGCNLLHRRLLGWSFERTLFHDPRLKPPLTREGLLTGRRVPLTKDNLMPALRATGAIPLIMSGVRRIPGAPSGTYLDGGLVDYHQTLPYAADPGGLVLIPHFLDRLIPGWLDKRLWWRHNRGRHLDNVLLVAPTSEFARRLPGGKIPDRTDFTTYFGRDAERIRIWEKATAACQCLAEEFMELTATGRIRGRVRPL